jgi:hypothetical protein
LGLQLSAQQPARLLGTVTSIEGSILTVKTESGETVAVQPETNLRVQQVTPGERDLRKASTIALTDVAAGDRVLVRGAKHADGFRADSIIVMSARAIAQRDQAVQKAWQEFGVFGVIEEINPASREIRVAARGGAAVVVAVSDQTSIRRYAPDSIRFADAVPAKLTDMKKGDQLRAKGEKAAGGTRVTADQLVFGTFRTVAATVSAVQADRNELAVKDIQTGKTLKIVVRPDSQLKKLAMGQGPGMRPGAPPTLAEGARARMAPAGGRTPDIGAMLDRMPAASLADLKPGETVIVSSTAGAKSDELTAIVLLAGAEPIVDMLRARSGPDPLAGGSSLDRGLDSIIGMPAQ